MATDTVRVTCGAQRLRFRRRLPVSDRFEPSERAANRVREGGVRAVETAYPLARYTSAAGLSAP